jgi:hypothetical protein
VAAKPALLAGGNPQIAHLLPDWHTARARRLTLQAPNVHKAIEWHEAWYGQDLNRRAKMDIEEGPGRTW